MLHWFVFSCLEEEFRQAYKPWGLGERSWQDCIMYEHNIEQRWCSLFPVAVEHLLLYDAWSEEFQNLMQGHNETVTEM